MWRKARLRSDCYFRKPARRKDVRTLRLQSFEPRRNNQIQSLLSALGLSEHSNQKPRDVRAALGHIALPLMRRGGPLPGSTCTGSLADCSTFYGPIKEMSRIFATD